MKHVSPTTFSLLKISIGPYFWRTCNIDRRSANVDGAGDITTRIDLLAKRLLIARNGADAIYCLYRGCVYETEITGCDDYASKVTVDRSRPKILM
ncbi:hypothetical protein IF1G_07705 [Cordyceps javanica]|uniref:Uncharacterized protein n=1 Tax=Cordyceps javanica TaxID=43265 RepID=A0A545UWX7_9HYPO|nr:hypothetical protein IF1G_07705 [Cordyceps javanica]TQW04747.1 hypothetical protein IF2G_07976 [Cordyceps javanica]